MNKEFFNDMQSMWMNNFFNNNWIKNMQEQNMHFCPNCSNMTDHMANVSKISAKFVQDNLNVSLEGLKSNLSAQNPQQMLENNQKFMQELAFNAANYAKDILAHSANMMSTYEDMAQSANSGWGSESMDSEKQSSNKASKKV